MVATRERIIREALRLFAERGYARTSVADIQEAAGLTSGSGALYKHFPSKRAVLETAVDMHIQAYEGGSQALLPALPEDPVQALELIGRGLLAQLDEDRDVVRVILRDVDQFPDLAERVIGGLLRPMYGGAAGWLRTRVAHEQMAVRDSDATAAVLLAAITYYRVLDALLGVVPGDVDEESFLRAWLELAAGLKPDHPQETS